MPEHIGTLGEKSLHASLKQHYSQPGDQLEVRVDGFVIDVLRDDLLIEIQTRNLYAMKRKLTKLLDTHRVHLIHPIPAARWIVRLAPDGVSVRKRRKSPKRGRVEDLFVELVRVAELALHPNLVIEAVMIHEEVVMINDGKGSWRRKGWSIQDRRLLEIIETHTFASPSDYLSVLPDSLPEEFTNKELAKLLRMPPRVVGKMTYTLRKMGLLEVTGKRGRAYLHIRVDPVQE